MTNLDSFTGRQEELIAIGASIAAGCRPCTAYHFKAAIAAGASRDQIRHAVDLALETRRGAEAVMAHLSDRLLAAIPPSAPATEPEPAYLSPLISAAAALALNWGADVARHVNSARDSHAVGLQVDEAFQIARAVRRMAGRRAETAAGRLTGNA